MEAVVGAEAPKALAATTDANIEASQHCNTLGSQLAARVAGRQVSHEVAGSGEASVGIAERAREHLLSWCP